MPLYGGNNGSDEQRNLENVRQAKINEGMGKINENFAQFDEPFYQKRAQEYTNFQLPELARQRTETGNSLAYSLARSGLTKSGTAAYKGAALDREYAQAARGLADEGQNNANQLRKDVEGNRSQLVAQLNASADPSFAAQQAVRSAGAFSAPQSFAPIGDAFASFTNHYVNNQIAKSYNDQTAPLFPAWGAPATVVR